MMKCKFIEAMAIACIFLQVEEMYPDQEKALTAFLALFWTGGGKFAPQPVFLI